MNDVNSRTLQEIVDFINLTPFQTDINLFERLNSDELLNIYIELSYFFRSSTWICRL